MSDHSAPVPPPATDAVALHRQLCRLARRDGVPWLHQETARRMAERLPIIREAPQHWIDWWGGLGAGAAAVAAALPHAQRHGVEPSEAWLLRSRREQPFPWWSISGWLTRAEKSSARDTRQERVVLDDGLLPPGRPPVQMVWANMVLHASPQPAEMISRWHGALQIGGFLMFSTLGPDTFRELRQIYAELGWPAPHPPFVDMHDIGDQLLHAGFADPVMDQERITLHWSSPQALLTELRGLGGNVSPLRGPGLRTPRWRERLCDALLRRADAQGRLGLSVELIYGHAFKVAPKRERGELATVSLESLRSSVRRRRQMRRPVRHLRPDIS